MQMRLPINDMLRAINRVGRMNRIVRMALKLSLVSAITLLASFQSIAAPQIRPGSFMNPPKVGERITPVVGSVVCFNELDAIGMARTGFFTTSCETFTDSTTLMAESIATRDVGEGLVLMVQTTFKNKPAWVPIPWHDWL